MPLKYMVESLDSIPETVRDSYVEADGKFVLDVEGVKPVDEFQKVYGSLEKERNDHKTTLEKLKAFGGKTPSDLVKLETRLMELEAAGGGELDEAQLDKILKQRLIPFEHQKEQSEAKIAELTGELQRLQQQAQDNARKDSVLSAIGDKIRPEFQKDLIYRAERELKYNPDIDAFVDDIGASLQEWAARQLRETPAWVVSSNGSGAKGGQGAPSSNVNPFAKGKGFNLTEQARLIREDPKKAEALKAQAASAAQ